MNGVQKPCRVQYTCDGIDSRDCGRSWRRRGFPNNASRRLGWGLQIGLPKSGPVSRRCWRSRWWACRKMVGSGVPPINPPNKAEGAPVLFESVTPRLPRGKSCICSPCRQIRSFPGCRYRCLTGRAAPSVALGSKLSFFPTELTLSSGPKTQKRWVFLFLLLLDRTIMHRRHDDSRVAFQGNLHQTPRHGC